MATEYNTLLLDTAAWDLCVDLAGNIALAAPPYALAQDVASAVRTFAGEVWYDTTLGVPYFSQVLGHSPPITLFKALIVQAALTVPGVVAASCYIQSIAGRKVTGQIQFTDSNGAATTLSLTEALTAQGT